MDASIESHINVWVALIAAAAVSARRTGGWQPGRQP